MRNKKTWKEKLKDKKDLPKVIRVSSKLAKRWGVRSGEKLVIPAPMDVDRIMKKVPKGKLITINRIREKLAKKYGVKICCPITTGIF